MKEPVNITICLVMALWMSCKTATAPQAAECGAGFLPCEDNITECCEVICPELHHHCGDFLTECCLDTTSHNFSFETFTFGGEPGTGSSAFYDVAIIDENNIWAVGEISMDSGLYGAAVWNGKECQLKQLMAGASNVRPRGIFAFSADNIWFASGSIYHWDGESVTLVWSRDISTTETIEKVWGSSPEDVWFVGSGGSIVHYDGSGFTRMESGTELNIYDIWGGYNAAGGDWEILCVGSNFMSDQPFQRVILKIENQIVRELSSRPVGYTLHSVWYTPGSTYFVAGSGIWHKASLQAVDWQLVSLQGYYIHKIRGSALNNIVAVGGYFEILHYNGLNWQRLDPGLPRTGNFKAISMKDELVVAVGLDSRFAYIWKGQKL